MPSNHRPCWWNGEQYSASNTLVTFLLNNVFMNNGVSGGIEFYAS